MSLMSRFAVLFTAADTTIAGRASVITAAYKWHWEDGDTALWRVSHTLQNWVISMQCLHYRRLTVAQLPLNFGNYQLCKRCQRGLRGKSTSSLSGALQLSDK